MIVAVIDARCTIRRFLSFRIMWNPNSVNALLLHFQAALSSRHLGSNTSQNVMMSAGLIILPGAWEPGATTEVFLKVWCTASLCNWNCSFDYYKLNTALVKKVCYFRSNNLKLGDPLVSRETEQNILYKSEYCILSLTYNNMH